MPVTTPTQTNYLYRISFASTVAERYTNIAEDQTFDGELYRFISITHTSPKFSAEPQEAEVVLTIHERNSIADLFTLGPPPFQVILDIFEHDRGADTVKHDYHGWIIRPSFDLSGNIINFRCKSVWHFFERESMSDSLAALSRYSIYDPRSGVDIESLRETITIDAFNDERDVLTISGTTEADDWYKGGLIVAPDRDMRTILQHVTETGLKKLYLTSAFPQTTLDTGFTADVYPGDDLTYGVWSVKFDAQTNTGANHGGWPFMPNVDPAVKGVI